MRISQGFKIIGLLLSMTAAAFAADDAARNDTDRALYAAVHVARDLMSSQDIYDKILSAGALSEIGDTKALGVLEQAVGLDDIVIRRSAIDTLITASHPNSVNLLMKIAGENPEVLGLMAESLASVPRGDMGDLLVQALRDNGDYVKKHALQAIVRSKATDQDDEVQKVVDDPQTSPLIKVYGLYALLSAGHKETIGRILEAAKSDDPDAREVAAVALGLVDSKDSKAALGQLTKDKDSRISLAAVASYAGLGDQDSIGRIIQLIGYGTAMEATVMAGAVKRLPPKMASQITDTVIACCHLRNDAATRLLESWGWIANDPAKVYAWGLGHKEADVRMQTAWLIGQRRDSAGVLKLVPFLQDEDPGIRGMAAWAIIHTESEHYVSGVET